MSNRIRRHRRTIPGTLGVLAMLTVATIGAVAMTPHPGKTLRAVVITGGGPPAACTWDARIFPNDADPLPPDPRLWWERYHATVDAVVTAHLANVPVISCGAPSVTPPTQELYSLAALLPPWRDDATLLRKVTEADIGTVLLEYARQYECSLKSAENFTAEDAAGTVETNNSIPIGPFAIDVSGRRTFIAQELKIARPALNRTLLYLSGGTRLQPLSSNLTCIERASLDLRNVLGLGAEASTCLMRAADAQGSLRALPASYP